MSLVFLNMWICVLLMWLKVLQFRLQFCICGYEFCFFGMKYLNFASFFGYVDMNVASSVWTFAISLVFFYMRIWVLRLWSELFAISLVLFDYVDLSVASFVCNVAMSFVSFDLWIWIWTALTFLLFVLNIALCAWLFLLVWINSWTFTYTFCCQICRFGRRWQSPILGPTNWSI